MDLQFFSETVWLIVIIAVLPVLSLFITVKLWGLSKLNKRKNIWLYSAAVASSLIAWPLAMVYLPLSYVGMPILMFLVLLLIAKLTPMRSFGVAAIFTIVFVVLETSVATLLYGAVFPYLTSINVLS